MTSLEDEPESPNSYHIPLNEEEHKLFQEFKKLDEGNARLVGHQISMRMIEEAKRPIGVDHPIVPIITNFAVDAYNQLIEMHVKKGESKNIYDVEIMRCEYINMTDAYSFYVTIEAVEEGIPGVYHLKVACQMEDGGKTLIRFVLTDDPPVGHIAMRTRHLFGLKSRYKNIIALTKKQEINVKKSHKYMKGFYHPFYQIRGGIWMRLLKGKKRGKAGGYLVQLKKKHKAMKVLCKVLYRNIQSYTSTTWNQRSNPDAWCVPCYNSIGLKTRRLDTTCEGYNYYDQSVEFIRFSFW